MIPGLILVKSLLDVRSQTEVTDAIESGRWNTELKRRVQHFGYRYDYLVRCIAPTAETPPIPEWGNRLIRQIQALGITMQEFDQMIVNEYLPGQGIAPHVDRISCFGNEIVSVSLGSPCVMKFSNRLRGKTVDVLLEPGDLLLIKDEARYRWHHEIRPRKSDKWNGQTIKRGRRFSVTFRKGLLTMPGKIKLIPPTNAENKKINRATGADPENPEWTKEDFFHSPHTKRRFKGGEDSADLK